MKIRDRIKELRRVSAKSLQPSAQNWRTHPKAQRDALMGVLAEIGYADALLARELADGSLQLIDGHLRAETTPDSEVPVLILDVTEAEAEKLLLTLDPISAMAGADAGKLDELLQRVTTQSAAVQEMLEGLARNAGVPRTVPVIEDEVPEPLAEPVSRLGDLWVLPGVTVKEGQSALRGHRLLCGDSTKPADVTRVMGGELAALVATDPPYLVEYTGERVGGSGKDWSDSYREVDITDADVFYRAVFTNVVSVLAPHAALYCWHAHKRQPEQAKVWRDLGILDHQQIVWVKPSAVFGSVFWHFRHEPCMMGWIKGSKPPHDGEHSFNSVWEVDWEGKSRIIGNEHPTQKPLELFARPMRKHTRAGDLCFEPFSGSGSQLIAAEQLHRRCRAIELEPRFVDVAVRRWQKLTGRSAVLEGTTITWAERARELGVSTDARDAEGGRAHEDGRKPKPTRVRGSSLSAVSADQVEPASGPRKRVPNSNLAGVTAPRRKVQRPAKGGN